MLHDTFGIKHGLMTTIHAYTADQRLQDMPHKDLRRARAAAVNLIPASTGAAKAIGARDPRAQRQAPRLRRPCARCRPAASSTSRSRRTARRPSRRSTQALQGGRGDGPLQGLLAYTEDPIVSSDIVKNPASSIVDSQLTAVMDGTMVKVVSWYDNEWGFSNRIVDLVQRLL